MSFLVDTSKRSNEKEIMDDFSLEGKLLRDTLDKIGRINQLLGGNQVTVKGLLKTVKDHSKDTMITIIDLGCGHGDILRSVSKALRKKGYKHKLIGVDANLDTINYAQELSGDFPEIEFLQIDIFSKEFSKLHYDVVLCTLFMHHFTNEELIDMSSKLLKKATYGIVINDLHRHKVAYYLFKIIGLFVKNEMVRKDGLTSILRAFKKQEIKELSNQLKANYSLQWKWAFRYQWILQNK